MTSWKCCSHCNNSLKTNLKQVSLKEHVRGEWQKPVWMCDDCLTYIRGCYRLIDPVKTTSDTHYVLHVDDDPNALSALRRRMRNKRFTILSAGTSTEAFDIASRYPLGAAIVDVWMPKMNGLEVMEALHKRDPALPVIILTGLDTQEVMEESISKGCAGYLEKPYNPTDLEAQLDAVIAR